jgi:hypothetical protein
MSFSLQLSWELEFSTNGTFSAVALFLEGSLGWLALATGLKIAYSLGRRIGCMRYG